MDNSIYEVERDEYKTFIGQLNLSMMDKEVFIQEDCVFTKIKSKKTGKHISTRINDNTAQTEHYYIFNYPDDDELVAPKPVLPIHLETRKEVQDFLNALSRLQKEQKND